MEEKTTNQNKLGKENNSYVGNRIRSREKLLEEIELDVSLKCGVFKRAISSAYELNKRDYELALAFQKKVKQAKLIKQLEDGWEYKVEYNDCGIYLYLIYYLNDEDAETDVNPLDIKKKYLLIFEQAKMLTLKEFSESCHVEEATVRQWMRKGKIKSAMKTGNGWLIPEFANVELRECMSGYYWETRLSYIPAKYEYLNSYCRLTIEKNDDGKTYNVTLFGFKGNTKLVSMLKKEKEAFELMLIANIDVKPFVKPMIIFSKGIYR